MPREIILVTPAPIALEVLVASAEEVDPTLRVRQAERGALLQLVDEADAEVVLTLQQSSALQVPTEVERLLPERSLTPAVRAAVYEASVVGAAAWTEAFAPFERHGERGVAIAQGIARRLGGACIVQDGR